MKKIINLVSAGIFALALNTSIFAQNNPIHGIYPLDSITAINQPQYIMLDGQSDDLPKILTKFQPPSTIIQKNNFYDIRILPSAGGDLIYIENAEIQSYSELYDMNGHLLLKKFNQTNNFTLNTSALKKGSYILVIRSKNHQISKKIAIK